MAFDKKSKIHRLLKQKNASEKQAKKDFKGQLLIEIETAKTVTQLKKVFKKFINEYN